MKYLAILKDSLYEALDTKVFYAMLGLSCLAIFGVASVSYRPVAVEGEVQKLADTMSWVLGLKGKHEQRGPTRIELTDFEQTNGDAPAWEGNYHFALLLHFTDAEAAQQERFAGKDTSRGIRLLLQRNLEYLKDLEVNEVPSGDPAIMRFDVTSQGTLIKDLGEWPHEPVIFFALPLPFVHWPIGQFVRFAEDTLVKFFGAAVALLLSTIITAFFIPNMLRKGTVDLLLVKPIHRSTLLIYKYIGGLTFIFLNTAFVVLGIWVVLGLRTGMWGVGFLASILVITFQFALYYAISTLFGVLTRSPIVAILMACLAWFFFALVFGYGYVWIDQTRTLPEAAKELKIEVDGKNPVKMFPDWVYGSADMIHFVTPRLKDLDVLTGKLIADDTLPSYSAERKVADKLYANFSWVESLLVTATYIVVLLAVSCWWFATKDY
jgi:ABC-type transport system involved in multi-copper enzyme maturation permease subunit